MHGRSRGATENYMRGFQYLADGHHVDDAGNLIACTYVDFRDPAERAPITTLRKASPKQHAIPSCGMLRILKPSCFRDRGEGLVLCGEEGVDESGPAGASADPEAAPAVNAASDDDTCYGPNGWIYCASIEPETPTERAAWRKATPPATTPFRRFAARGRSRGRWACWRPSRPARGAERSYCGARWTARRSPQPTGAKRSTTARSSTRTIRTDQCKSRVSGIGPALGPLTPYQLIY